MSGWKYSDATNKVVIRINDSGAMESCLATAPEFVEWIAQGNTPLPADVPPLPTKAEQIAALLAQYGIAQEWQLDRDIGNAQVLAGLVGMTEPQIYATNAAYHMAKDLKAQLDAIRAAP